MHISRIYNLGRVKIELRVLPVLLLALTIAACDMQTTLTPQASLTPSTSDKLTLSSPAFADGGAIPRDFTCDGQNHSPALQWSDPPAGTRTFALVVQDPDAPNGTFTHWLLYNMPSTGRGLPEGMPAASDLPDGSKQGTTSFNRTGYGGPCPPSGTHHYHFKLYAVDYSPDLASAASVSQLESALQGHVLATGELVGTYSR